MIWRYAADSNVPWLRRGSRRLRNLTFVSIVAWLALLVQAGGALADVRIALVIGNAKYANTAPLGNPANDASDVAQALTDLGFKVSLHIDATKRQLDQAIEQFARDAKTPDVALAYYAGHGMQFQGRNYLVPVDAELRDEISVHYELSSVDDLKGALMTSNGVRILVLDSCRDNPLAENLV